MSAGKPPWDKGRVQVYTGSGKGKTTAALGVALRAAGAGIRVFIGQFCKGQASSEATALERFADCITLQRYGCTDFICGPPTAADIAAAQAGFAEIKAVLAAGEYPLVILDEACIACHFALIEPDELCAAIAARPPHVEVIVTGRNAPEALTAMADLVTEMREIKHYYADGVNARQGIEC